MSARGSTEPISNLLAAVREFIGRGVGLFCKLVAMLLVALWPGVTSHSLLTHSGLIHVVHADHDHARGHDGEHHHHGHSHEHESSDGASHEHNGDNHAFADGDYRSTPVTKLFFKPLLNGVFAAGAVIIVQVPPSALLVDSPGPAPPGSRPELLQQTWQFSYRTALPGRAPSFLS